PRFLFFFSSRRRHTRSTRDWSSDVCSSDLEAAEGERIRYSPAILPPYARRSKSLEVLIPILYLKGISTGDFEEALAALVGEEAEIGRASCRERVERSGGDVCVKRIK